MNNNVIEIVGKYIDQASAGIKSLRDDLQETEKSTRGVNDAGTGFLGTASDMAVVFSFTATAVTTLAGALKKTVDAYAEAEVVGAQVNAVLQSTSGIAGVSADEIEQYANSLSRVSGVDDEIIQRGEALLLTFTKIGKDSFPQATEAALNMSVAMGTDLQSSILQVGKALNSPIEGASALRRVGVQLTDQQEDQIKAFMAVNDIASAQKIILDELQVEFGGVAEAMGDTTTGAANKLENAMGNLWAEMGKGPAGGWKSFNEQWADYFNTQADLASVGNQTAQAYTLGAISLEEYQRVLQFASSESVTVEQAQLELNDAIAGGSNARWEALAAYYATTTAIDEQSTATAELAVADAEAVKGAMQVHDTYEKLGEKMTDLQTDHAELLTKKQELELIWGSESQKIQDVNEKLADNEQKQKDVTTAMQGTLTQMLLNTAAAGLDAEGQLALARATGQIDEETYAALTAQALLKQQYEDGTLTADQYAKKTLELRDAVNNLESKDVTITVDGIFNEIRNVYTNYDGNYLANLPNYANGTDGWQEVPAGYPNDSYPVMMQSGERFAVIPAGVQASPTSVGGMGGGGSQFVYAPVYSGVSFGDESEIKNRIFPWFLEMLEQAKANGHV